MDEAPRIRLMGAEMDVTTAGEVMDFAAARVRARRGGLVANHNLHSLHLLGKDSALGRFYASADLIEIDSTPLIAWGRLLGFRLSAENRCTYLDWRETFWARARAEGWRVYHLGCAPGVTEKAVQAVQSRHPGVEIGGRDGFFDVRGAENARVLEDIAAFDPDILLVGMGMPRQERWILDNRAALGRAVVFPIGAAFDYEADVVATPPRWAGRLGLEWLFRLAVEPRRLFVRYLVEPWSLIPAALGDLRRRARRAGGVPGPARA